MEWKKTNQDIAAELEKLVSGYDCRKKPMFGSPVYFVNDNMWTGAKGDIVFLRLSKDDLDAIHIESDEISAFEPRPGLIMKEYVEIPDSKLYDDSFAQKWLDISYQYVTALPAKVKKEKKVKIK